jgi:hypothetical protein
MEPSLTSEVAIKALVRNAVKSFAAGFRARHEGEFTNPNGTLNMKIHNVFIAVLGPEIQYYTALVRSFDSSLGNMLEGLAIEIGRLFYDVHRHVEGSISLSQIRGIAELLERYKNRQHKPKIADYSFLRQRPDSSDLVTKRHDSDYYLIDRFTGHHYLIELKIGGDLDNKKARSEKEAILEQFAILSNGLSNDAPINVYFATGYNRYGEGKPWRQERVRQFFADDELLIGKNFWNFISHSPDGYMWVLDAYRESAPLICDALTSIKDIYLGGAASDHPPTV